MSDLNYDLEEKRFEVAISKDTKLCCCDIIQDNGKKQIYPEGEDFAIDAIDYRFAQRFVDLWNADVERRRRKNRKKGEPAIDEKGMMEFGEVGAGMLVLDKEGIYIGT